LLTSNISSEMHTSLDRKVELKLVIIDRVHPSLRGENTTYSDYVMVANIIGGIILTTRSLKKLSRGNLVAEYHNTLGG